MNRRDWPNRAWHWSTIAAASALLVAKTVRELARSQTDGEPGRSMFEVANELVNETTARAKRQDRACHHIRAEWLEQVAGRVHFAMSTVLRQEPPAEREEPERGQLHFGEH